MANKLYEENNIRAIAEAIRAKGVSGTMTVAQMASKVASIIIGITPSGTKTITENGSDIDVTNYAKVNVDVSASDIVSVFNSLGADWKLAFVETVYADKTEGATHTFNIGNAFTKVMVLWLPNMAVSEYGLLWYQYDTRRSTNIAIGYKPSSGTQYQSNNAYVTNPTVSGTSLTITMAQKYGVLRRGKYLVMYQ